MIKKRIAKIGALTVGMTFALGLVASPAAAQTMAELQAQITALMAQLAALQGGSSAPSMTFTQNLTLGSTGSEVTALQQALVAGGHLSMPAGVAYGYFGALTKAAVAKWQAANGVSPAAGYWGSISRARYASMAGPALPGPTTPGAGITTPGVEGTLTASLNPTPVSGEKVYEGDSQKSVLGIKLEAKTSDIKVERIKVQIPSTTFYNRVANRIYVMDGSTVVGSADLNSSTVVREGSTYFITIAGMSYVVPKDATRVLSVAFNINSSVDTTYRTGPYAITVPASGVRGVDGAGINQYSPDTTPLTRSIAIETAITDAAELKISLNVNSPKTTEVVASAGTDEDELDGLELLRFDLRAEKDSIMVRDFTVTLVRSGAGVATTSTFYLYDGSTMIASESGVTAAGGGNVKFSNIDYTVSKDATRTLSFKVDIRDAGLTSAATSFTGVVSTTAGIALVAENSLGDVLIDGKKTGSAGGEVIVVRKVGPEVSLVSKTIVKDTIGFSGATSTARATFNLRVKAVGGDVYFGPQASTTFAFQSYKGGVATGLANVSSSTSWSIPSGVVTSGTGITSGGFKLSEGQEVTIPVDFLFEGRTGAGALIGTDAYAIGLENLKWNLGEVASVTSNFMSGKTEWRTTTVTMP